MHWELLMEPIRYVDFLNEKYQSLGFPAYQWTVNETAPLTPLGKPLDACCVSILTTCGASTVDAPPFNPDARNDLRLDAIASDTPDDRFQVHDNYYDHTDVRRDINCQFPIARLNELAAAGRIGRVAARLWSGFMGRIYIRSAVVNEAAPAFAEQLKRDGVDVLVVVPACPLDHQTAGLVARVVEESGIATVNVSTGRDLSAQVKPPRTLFVNHPMGDAFGRPFDRDGQRRILLDALELATRDEPGLLVDGPYEWSEPFQPVFRETNKEQQREYQLKKA
jgi:hypothetical protein